jgi:hypothetical protein
MKTMQEALDRNSHRKRDGMYPNVEELLSSLEHLANRQRELDRIVGESTSAPPGPYSFYHHHGHLVERLSNVAQIIERIGRARWRFTVLNERRARIEPKRPPKPGAPFSKKAQAIIREEHQLTQRMRLDVESLYIFANMALDQWAYTIAYGLEAPDSYDFRRLVEQLQVQSPIDPIRTLAQRHLRDVLWLFYQLRFYRNNFIEHVRRPWQRGSSMTVYGSDFNFFVPSPSGWIPATTERQMIADIYRLAPQWVKDLPDDHWQKKPRATLEAMFREIDRIPKQADREKVWAVWSEIGGSVVSFDVLSSRLVAFLLASLETLTEAIQENPDKINLGPSPHAEAAL